MFSDEIRKMSAFMTLQKEQEIFCKDLFDFLNTPNKHFSNFEFDLKPSSGTFSDGDIIVSAGFVTSDNVQIVIYKTDAVFEHEQDYANDPYLFKKKYKVTYDQGTEDHKIYNEVKQWISNKYDKQKTAQDYDLDFDPYEIEEDIDMGEQEYDRIKDDLGILVDDINEAFKDNDLKVKNVEFNGDEVDIELAGNPSLDPEIKKNIENEIRDMAKEERIPVGKVKVANENVPEGLNADEQGFWSPELLNIGTELMAVQRIGNIKEGDIGIITEKNNYGQVTVKWVTDSEDKEKTLGSNGMKSIKVTKLANRTAGYFGNQVDPDFMQAFGDYENRIPSGELNRIIEEYMKYPHKYENNPEALKELRNKLSRTGRSDWKEVSKDELSHYIEMIDVEDKKKIKETNKEYVVLILHPENNIEVLFVDNYLPYKNLYKEGGIGVFLSSDSTTFPFLKEKQSSYPGEGMKPGVYETEYGNAAEVEDWEEGIAYDLDSGEEIPIAMVTNKFIRGLDD